MFIFASISWNLEPFTLSFLIQQYSSSPGEKERDSLCSLQECLECQPSHTSGNSEGARFRCMSGKRICREGHLSCQHSRTLFLVTETLTAASKNRCQSHTPDGHRPEPVTRGRSLKLSIPIFPPQCILPLNAEGETNHSFL